MAVNISISRDSFIRPVSCQSDKVLQKEMLFQIYESGTLSMISVLSIQYELFSINSLKP